jgi:hypothetical protein
MTREIMMTLTKHPGHYVDDEGVRRSWRDDGYSVYDLFDGLAIEEAQEASTVEEAEAILRAAYRGPDVDGVGVRWVIR